MVQKYIYGTPFETEAVVQPVPIAAGAPAYGGVSTEDGFSFRYALGCEDIVYGLGEAVRGINKRGFRYTSNCTDIPRHFEDCESMYGAHNFILVSGAETFGLFFDYPAAITFDIGYTACDWLEVSCPKADLALYVITGTSPETIVKQFRQLIGRSYIAPRFAFGYGQSRWGYKTKAEFRELVRQHHAHHVPLDMLYMDIDYMDHYKDFTLSEEFDDFPAFVQELKDAHVRLIPIIDAGVKVEPGYSVYEEGVAKNYFCKRADGSDFVAAVWPGDTHFPDVLNPAARRWFGDNYRFLLEQGIEGFWNDMNEPAIFYTPEGLQAGREILQGFIADPDEQPLFMVQDIMNGLANNPKDYARFYHNVDGKPVCHETVHNLFGYSMTRAAGEAFTRLVPDRRVLMFSRSSYVGMHRYGGIWTGDNLSWWSHILLNLKMLPSLNMVGILYTGADLGGFGSNTSRDLLLRWLALGVFTPLMRNHAALGTRDQEFYRFERPEDFAAVIGVRYRLIPYLYSEYMKACLNDDMLFRPLAFAFPGDKLAAETEDQLLLGNELMIAPVYTQNASGRYVYLPEDMLFVKFLPDGSIARTPLNKGIHYVSVALNEVPLFVRSGKCFPVAPVAEYAEAVTTENLQLIGYGGASYTLYEDDGITTDYSTGTCRELHL